MPILPDQLFLPGKLSLILCFLSIGEPLLILTKVNLRVNGGCGGKYAPAFLSGKGKFCRYLESFRDCLNQHTHRVILNEAKNLRIVGNAGYPSVAMLLQDDNSGFFSNLLRELYSGSPWV